MNARIVPLGSRRRSVGRRGLRPSWMGQLRRVEGLQDQARRSRCWEWANPHAHLMLKHEGVMWEATLAPLSRMEARGLTA